MPDFPNYFDQPPTPQNAFDLFKGEWSTRLPDACGWTASTGPARLCEDYRVHWAAGQLGGFAGKRVLELGPLEGGHAYMLEQLNAASVLSLEASSRAFLKSLILKEAFGLTRTRFLLGDFMHYLRAPGESFDVIFACGVLYHMVNPVELIALMAKRGRAAFIWTQCYDPVYFAAHPQADSFFQPGRPATHEGFAHTLYRKSYGDSTKWSGFCGGSADANWMTRGDIVAAFQHFGFTVAATLDETNVHGPALLLAVTKA